MIVLEISSLKKDRELTDCHTLQCTDHIPGATHLNVLRKMRCIDPALPQCPILVIAQY